MSIDPNQTLKRVRTLNSRLTAPGANYSDLEVYPMTIEIAVLYTKLDEYITQGGSLPDDWKERNE